MEEKLMETASAWKKARRVLVFTGAGMSAESGVPTFRGPGGIWNRFDVEKAAYLQSFLTDPRPFWELARELMLKAEARPHPGHYALARLEKKGYLQGVITQNIDGLHQKAGSREVYELHGSLDRLDCLDCQREYSWEGISGEVESGEVKCACGSKKVKPRIVFFGESLPREVMDRSMEIAGDCDLLLVVGSSLGVFPAASIPQLAWQRGAKMVLINSEKTYYDDMFNWVFRKSAGRVLPELEKIILGGEQEENN